MGRKGKYSTHVEPYLEKVKELAASESEEYIANELGVSSSSFENYKSQHEELRKALKEGKLNGREAKVRKYKSLLEQRAEGFHYTETKKIIRSVDGVKTQIVEEYEKYSPPDVGALHLLLKNMDDNWTNDDKQTMDIKKEKIALEKLKMEMNNW